MAIFVATDFSVSINGSTALASYLTQVELKATANDVTTTAFGSSWVTRVAGLKEGSLTLQFNQDYAASTVDATLWPLLGSNATVVIKPYFYSGFFKQPGIYSHLRCERSNPCFRAGWGFGYT
jgi:hypothetical protein